MYFIGLTYQVHVLNNINPQILYDVYISNQMIYENRGLVTGHYL